MLKTERSKRCPRTTLFFLVRCCDRIPRRKGASGDSAGREEMAMESRSLRHQIRATKVKNPASSSHNRCLFFCHLMPVAFLRDERRNELDRMKDTMISHAAKVLSGIATRDVAPCVRTRAKKIQYSGGCFQPNFPERVNEGFLYI